jgi:hypothetical protein
MAQYEVIHQQVTVPQDNASQPVEFRLTAPTGKDPLAGGWKTNAVNRLRYSYPDGADWVFVYLADSNGDFTVDLYVTCL